MTKREELLAEAKKLNIEFPKNIKTPALEAAIAEVKMNNTAKEAYEDAGGEVDENQEPEQVTMTPDEIRAEIEREFNNKLEIEKAKMAANMELNIASAGEEAANNRQSVGQAKLNARRKAMSLIRINVSCNDPMKTSWTGELISAGNDVVGSITKYVLFNTVDGYHVPKIVYNTLKDKMCTVFVNKKINGQMSKVAKQIKAYTIEVLPQLTVEELAELGKEQQARGATDED